MKYATIGTGTSAPEVTDISPFGIWLLSRGKEYFLGYDDFPWFRDAPVRQVFSVTEEGFGHLRWPSLDIDLSIDSIKDPGAFPLVYEQAPDYPKSDAENE